MELLPSPKIQTNPAIEPSGSEDPAELKLTASGAWPEVGVAAATATGGKPSAIVTVAMSGRAIV